MRSGGIERYLWLGLGTAAALGAGLAARKTTAATWRRLRDEEPPVAVNDPASRWPAVLVWAAISGMAVTGAQLLARRLADKAWQKRLEHKR